MDTLIKLFILAGGVVLLGTFLMFGVESNEPNSEIKTLEDALWWCIATVTTVGYGDVVPVSDLGRFVAMVYMGFGIAMITILLSTITTRFYKKRFEAIKEKTDKEELNQFEKELMQKLLDLEKKQNQCLDMFTQLDSKIKGKMD